MGHFSPVAKVALRFGCAKESKNLKRYLMNKRVSILCDRHCCKSYGTISVQPVM